MKKIPTLFKRDPNNMQYVLDEINPDCQWVFDGEGVATRKYDGTCMKLDENGKWWQRRELKKNRERPSNFVFSEFDPVTLKTVGWIPMDPHGYFHPFLQALGLDKGSDDILAAIDQHTNDYLMTPGTYELIGPKINGNPEGVTTHTLIPHADAKVLETPSVLNFKNLKFFMSAVVGRVGYEGVVWHHPDGRMAKLKVHDFRKE